MILTFSRRRSAALGVVLVAVLAAGCTRGSERVADDERQARVAELLGALKLVRQEYPNAVVREGGAILDATEYAESELFAEQAETKLAALRAAGGIPDPERAAAIAAGIAATRDGVARQVPPSEVVATATAVITQVEELLAGTVPAALRGVVLATTRADEAIVAEAVLGDYRVGVVTGAPRPLFARTDAGLVPMPPAPEGSTYVAIVLRERRTKRLLPAATIQLTVVGAGGRREAALAELWGDFHQYGGHLVLPADGPVTLAVTASPPAYARHGDMLGVFVEPVTASFEGQVRDRALAFDAKPVTPIDDDYRIGDDVLQATTEAGELREAGPYRIGLIVEGPEPIWIWRSGVPTLEPVAPAATNHVEVVLVDRETGQLVPRAHVTLDFLAAGAPVGTAMLHPLLSAFAHYGVTTAVPADATAVRVRVDPPALGSVDRPRLADPVEIELPIPARARKVA